MNNSTGANAAIRLSLNVGSPAGNDPKISFNIGDGGFDWTMGVDNSDSDKFKISGGTDSHNPNLGTNDRLVIDSSGNVGIGISSPQSKLHIGESATVGSNFTTAVNNSQLFVHNVGANTNSNVIFAGGDTGATGGT